MPSIETNGPFPSRIVLNCDPLIGPFGSTVLGPLDPRRDLTCYVDGDILNIVSFSFDSINNRYLLFADRSFNLQGVVQLTCHMPNPPFTTIGGGGIPPVFTLDSAVANGSFDGGPMHASNTPATADEWALYVAYAPGVTVTGGYPTAPWIQLEGGGSNHLVFIKELIDTSTQTLSQTLSGTSPWVAMMLMFEGGVPILQQSNGSGFSGTVPQTSSAAFGSVSRPGNSLMVVAMIDVGDTVPFTVTCTDDQLNTYVQVANQFTLNPGGGAATSGQVVIFTSDNIIGGTATNITLHVTGPGGDTIGGSWFLFEFASANFVLTPDSVASNTNTGNPTSTVTLNSTNRGTDDFSLFVGMGNAFDGGSQPTVPAGYTSYNPFGTPSIFGYLNGTGPSGPYSVTSSNLATTSDTIGIAAAMANFAVVSGQTPAITQLASRSIGEPDDGFVSPFHTPFSGSFEIPPNVGVIAIAVTSVGGQIDSAGGGFTGFSNVTDNHGNTWTQIASAINYAGFAFGRVQGQSVTMWVCANPLPDTGYVMTCAYLVGSTQPVGVFGIFSISSLIAPPSVSTPLGGLALIADFSPDGP